MAVSFAVVQLNRLEGSLLTDLRANPQLWRSSGWAHWGFTGAFTRYEFTDSSSNNLAPVDYNDDDGWLPSLEFLANLIASVSSAGPRSLGSVTVVSFATSLLIAHCRCYVVFD